MRRYDLFLDGMIDPVAKEAFRALQQALIAFPMGGFHGRHIEMTLPSGTHLYPHNLLFRPKDIFPSWLEFSSGTGTWVWNYSAITKDNLSVTITTSVPGAMATMRAYIGRHLEA